MWSFVKVAVIICLCLTSILADPKRKTSRRNGVYKPSNLYSRRHPTLIPNDRLSALAGVNIVNDEAEDILDDHPAAETGRVVSVKVNSPASVSHLPSLDDSGKQISDLIKKLLGLLGQSQPAQPDKIVTLAELQQLLSQLLEKTEAANRVSYDPLQNPIFQTNTAIRQSIPGLVTNQILYDPLSLQQINPLMQTLSPTTPSGLYQNTPNGLYQQTPSAFHQHTPNGLYQHTPQLAYPFRSSISQNLGGYSANPQPAYVNGGTPTYYYSPQYYPPTLYERSSLNQARLLQRNQLGLLTQATQAAQAAPTSTTPQPTTSTATTTTTTTPAPSRSSWWLPFPFGNFSTSNTSSGSGNRWQLVLDGPGRSVEGKSTSNSKPLLDISNMTAMRKLEHGTARTDRSLGSEEDVAIPSFEDSMVGETPVPVPEQINE